MKELDYNPLWYSTVDSENPFIVESISKENLDLYSHKDGSVDPRWLTWNREGGGPLIDQDKIHGRIVERKVNGIRIGLHRSVSEFKRANIKKCEVRIRHCKKDLDYEKERCLSNGKMNRVFLETYMILQYLDEYMSKKLFNEILFDEYMKKVSSKIYDDNVIRNQLSKYNDISNYRKLYKILTGEDDKIKARLMRNRRDDIFAIRLKEFDKNNPGVMEFVRSAAFERRICGGEPFKIFIDNTVDEKEVNELVYLYNRNEKITNTGYYRKHYVIDSVKKEKDKYVLQLVCTF